MSHAFTKLALGVSCEGGAFHLTALGRRFGRLRLLDELHLSPASKDTAAARVAAFLDRHGLREARVVACLPREAVLVRFLDLPAEAEPQLAKVVSYQLAALHPFQDGQVYWDCAVADHDPKSGQLTALVVLAEKSRLNSLKHAVDELGLRLSGFILGGAALARLLKPQLPPAALVVSGRTSGLELLSFRQGNLCATQEVPLEPSGGACERLEREWHRALAALPVTDPAAVPRYVCGSVPAAFSDLLEGALPLPAPRLNLPQRFTSAPFDWTSLAAAHWGLTASPSAPINLLPVEQRWQPQVGALPFVYALGGTAALLALTLASHAWIERALYGRALDAALERLEKPAQQLRRQNEETNALEARAALLEGVRDGNWRMLRLLDQLTLLLPDGTWLQQLQISTDSVEIYGFSDHAADLVPLLDSSPYFSQADFTSPITRDNRNKEVFRIRMRLKPAARN
jgi:Tfp pilus assembly protein PilN